ncbi:hypothetical protein FNH13_18525 [Ornithinimicrobium ciconiae]|uniref:Uncharacterized protein n=1 Tax=Ornithinimicrobium ciconiae TaxID=2594265 RepID=A0A516GEY4_9MICO|nr:hypothetical protein [Ornithinimicrobium ciconiae]QDO90075.1 hypothetical protein FNH13_18525 [Ornithinimicrobium ciconiae]
MRPVPKFWTTVDGQARSADGRPLPLRPSALVTGQALLGEEAQVIALRDGVSRAREESLVLA